MRLIALIFREWILPPSETFIIEQGKALRRYDPVLAGLCLKGSGNYAKIPQVLLTSRSGYLANAAVKAYRYTGFAPQFHRHLRSIHASIVHAHFATDAVSALLIAEYLDLPLVVTLHGYDVTTDDVHLARTLRGRHYLKRRRRLFERTTRFLCVSKSIRDAAARAGFPEEKLQVHYTGVDCERFQPNHVGRDPKLVLFVRRMVEKKACQNLISAMKQVLEEDPQAKLDIIGDGPLGPELKAMAAMF
jgi:colanic acid/amylovoran biosynthesis glycosyltransferase